MWNWTLGARRKAYARRGETLTSVHLSRLLTRMKRSKMRTWLAEAPSSCIGQKLRDLDTAYRNAFAGRARLPRFKSRRSAQRVRVTFDQRHAGKVRAWLEGRIVLPELGAVALRGRSPADGDAEAHHRLARHRGRGPERRGHGAKRQRHPGGVVNGNRKLRISGN